MKYHLLLQAPKKSIKRKEETNFSVETMENVEEISRMLNSTGAEWYLVGGLEASMLFGSITRPHTDIDIEIDETQIPSLSKGMKQFGYTLCEKVASIPLPSRTTFSPFPDYQNLTLYREVTSKRKTKSKDLRLVNKKINDPYSLLGIIDVKVCQRNENGATIYNKGKPIRINKTYQGKNILVGNEQIRCRNTDYLKILKATSKNKADAYDLILLDVAISKNMYKQTEEKK